MARGFARPEQRASLSNESEEADDGDYFRFKSQSPHMRPAETTCRISHQSTQFLESYLVQSSPTTLVLISSRTRGGRCGRDKNLGWRIEYLIIKSLQDCTKNIFKHSQATRSH